MKGLKKLRRNYNKKGNAALIALLLVIIIVGIAASVMILAGRNSIDEDDKYQKDKSSSANEVMTTTIPAVTEPEKPKVLDLYSKQASDFKQTSINGFTAQASILIDATSDTAIAGKNMDQRIFPASMTKVMTILVACENLNSYDDTYTFKEADLVKPYEQNATMAGFKAGEAVTARDMLYGAILPSGADACIGLANLVAGSEASFVKMMNARAKELGLKNTNFVNTTGIHDLLHLKMSQNNRNTILAISIKGSAIPIVDAKGWSAGQMRSLYPTSSMTTIVAMFAPVSNCTLNFFSLLITMGVSGQTTSAFPLSSDCHNRSS